jgi:hypothetical protein
VLRLVSLLLTIFSVFGERGLFEARVYLDFRWAMATRVLKWLDLAARQCNIRTTIMPVNSSKDLVSQRVFQAFKKQKPYVIISDADRDSFNGVLSPLYIYSGELINCLSLEEFKTCKFNKVDNITHSSEICVSKIKQSETSGFKIAYFILMLILLILTLLVSFFW